MVVYILNLFITCFLLFITRNDLFRNESKVKRRIMIILSLLVITSVAGFRYRVGTDFIMYESFFYKMSSFTFFSSGLETIFILLGKISFFLNPHSSTLMFYLIALWIYSLIFIIVIRKSEYYDLSIFLFITFGFFTSSLNGLRQWMAIPLIYFVIDYLSRKDFVKGFLFFILAFLCHKSVLLLFPFLVLCYLIKKETTRFIIILLSIFLYMNYGLVNSLIYNLLGNIDFFAKYIKYMTVWGELNTNVLVMPMFTLVSYVGYYFFIYKRKIKISEFYRLVINALIFGFFTALLGTKIHYFERIQYYFVLSLIFVIPLIYSKMSNKNKKIILVFCLVMGFAFYIYSLIKNGANPLPYQTVFNI